MTTIVLGGVTLHPDMIWRERFTDQKVAQSAKRTLGGALVVFAGSLHNGAPITLATAESTGYPTRAMVDAVRALAEVAGAQYTLSFHGTDYSVIFRPDESGGNAVVMEPLKKTNRPEAGDWMRGEIRLLTV